MDNQSARDPFLGINEHIRAQARGLQAPCHAVGKVVSAAPLRIRAEGLDLSGEDLRMAWHLTDEWHEQLCDVLGGYPKPVLPSALKAGDTVLLMPSEDRQIYYILDKFVEVAR